MIWPWFWMKLSTLLTLQSCKRQFYFYFYSFTGKNMKIDCVSCSTLGASHLPPLCILLKLAFVNSLLWFSCLICWFNFRIPNLLDYLIYISHNDDLTFDPSHHFLNRDVNDGRPLSFLRTSCLSSANLQPKYHDHLNKEQPVYFVSFPICSQEILCNTNVYQVELNEMI